MWRYLIISVSIILTAGTVSAEDYVRVKYMPGFPLPNESMETVDIEIKRMPSIPGSPQVDVDRYFDSVSKILAEDKIRTDWGLLAIDAPSVRVDISIADKKISLAATYTSKGIIDTAPGPDERPRRALQEILKLTLKRLKDKVPVK